MRRAVLSLLLLPTLAGCFTVEYKLPPRTYFGRLAGEPGERPTAFEHEEQKNWFLAGLAPYSKFGVSDMLSDGRRHRRVEGLELESRFSEVDVLIWVFPGQVYGYYFWAPRTLRVRGTKVDTE